MITDEEEKKEKEEEGDLLSTFLHSFRWVVMETLPKLILTVS